MAMKNPETIEKKKKKKIKCNRGEREREREEELPRQGGKFF